jgi:fucose permease
VLLTRISAPAILARFSEAVVTRVGLALAIAGTAVALTASALPAIIAGVTLAGLGLAPVFPLFLAYMYRRFGAAAGRAASLLYILGGLGGACLPWLVGIVSTGFQSLKAALAMPVVCMAVMLILHLATAPSRELPTSASPAQ